MSLSVGRTRLMNSLKELRQRWDKAERLWDDPVSKEFEQEFIAPLEGNVRAAVAAMENMYVIVCQARKECGDS